MNEQIRKRARECLEERWGRHLGGTKRGSQLFRLQTGPGPGLLQQLVRAAGHGRACLRLGHLPASISNFEMPAHRKQNMWYLIVISEPSMMERSDSAVVSFFWLWQIDVIMMFIISFISYFIIVIIKPIFFGTDRSRRSFSERKQ